MDSGMRVRSKANRMDLADSAPSRRRVCCSLEVRVILRWGFDGASMVFRWVFEGIQGFSALCLPSLLPAHPPFLSSAFCLPAARTAGRPAASLIYSIRSPYVTHVALLKYLLALFHQESKTAHMEKGPMRLSPRKSECVMKTSFKGLLPLLLLALPAVMQAQFNYMDNGDGTATITEYTGAGGAVIIPGTVLIDGLILSVTSIGDEAFQGCSRLTSVTITNSVTRLGDGAFQGCSGLTKVTMANSITNIGKAAFAYCASLASIILPNSVTSIGAGEFGYCGNLTSVTIPKSVTSIGDEAFNSCANLVGVTIPDSVTSIGVAAFEYCVNLGSVPIPSHVRSESPASGTRRSIPVPIWSASPSPTASPVSGSRRSNTVSTWGASLSPATSPASGTMYSLAARA